MANSFINPATESHEHEYRAPLSDKCKVTIRKFPYPYKAAMAICSDIDQTNTVSEFLKIQQFLNTKKMTGMGEGIGLEIGNSFFFYDRKGDFSFFSHDDRAQRTILDLMQAGYIDCMHSYGDAATIRDEVLRALDILYKNECKLDVWINHFGAPSNFSRKFEYMLGICRGDNPKSRVYHADVTLEYGIRFVWVGATTRVIGQSSCKSSTSLTSVFDPQWPLGSSIDVLKEIRKRALGQWADERFIIHKRNKLARVTQLEDGQKIHEFMRYCHHPRGISFGATNRGLAYVISRRSLKHLKAKQGFMIVYTHLGKNDGCKQVIAKETQAALRNLEREYRNGNIYLTTTSKLLNYYLVSKYLEWSYRQSGEYLQIDINHLNDPVFGLKHLGVKQLQGVTFYVPDSSKVEVFLQGVMVQGLQRNPADNSGNESVTIPFSNLCFPY